METFPTFILHFTFVGKNKLSLLTLYYKYIIYNKIYKREILILTVRKRG